MRENRRRDATNNPLHSKNSTLARGAPGGVLPGVHLRGSARSPRVDAAVPIRGGGQRQIPSGAMSTASSRSDVS